MIGAEDKRHRRLVKIAAGSRIVAMTMRAIDPECSLVEVLKYVVAGTIVGFDGNAHRTIDRMGIDIQTRVKKDGIKVEITTGILEDATGPASEPSGRGGPQAKHDPG